MALFVKIIFSKYILLWRFEQSIVGRCNRCKQGTTYIIDINTLIYIISKWLKGRDALMHVSYYLKVFMTGHWTRILEYKLTNDFLVFLQKLFISMQRRLERKKLPLETATCFSDSSANKMLFIFSLHIFIVFIIFVLPVIWVSSCPISYQ